MAGYPGYPPANNAYPYGNGTQPVARAPSYYGDSGNAQQMQPQMAYPTPSGSYPAQNQYMAAPQQPTQPSQQQNMMQQPQQHQAQYAQQSQQQSASTPYMMPQQSFQQSIPSYAMQQQQQQSSQQNFSQYMLQQQQYSNSGQINGHQSATYTPQVSYTNSGSHANQTSNQTPFYQEGGEDVIATGGNDMPKPSYGFCCSQGKRNDNEDRLFARSRLTAGISHITAFGVFDGHGGSHAAEFCMDYIPRFLEISVQQYHNKGISLDAAIIERILRDCFRVSDQEFIKRAGTIPSQDLTSISHSLENKNIQTSGCTACVVLTNGHTIYCANAGDSRAVLYNSQKDSIVELSQLHKPSDPAEQQRILAAGGQVSFSGGCARINNILGTSRGIGDSYLKQCVIPDPAIVSHELRAGDDFLVIATDGLWDVFSPSSVCTMALEAGEAKLAAKMLTEKAIQSGSEDNVGVIVVDLRTIFLWPPITKPAVMQAPVPAVKPAPQPAQPYNPPAIPVQTPVVPNVVQKPVFQPSPPPPRQSPACCALM